MSGSQLRPGDALVIVDVQNDFVTGSLAVPEAKDIIAPLNRYIALFVRDGLRIVATRDWHPASHMSFREQGGPWPPHCVAQTPGAEFAPGLHLPEGTWLVSKATSPSREAYSAFERTDLDHRLKGFGAKRLFVGGLATDYCVLRTVLDSLARGYVTFVLEDAIRAVEANPGDGENATAAMQRDGAAFVRYEDLLEGDDFSP